MALVLADRVKETTTTTGTGTYTLAGAVTGFESFATIGNSNTTYYCCTDGTDFEVGIGTYTASGTTLARTTILQSSNSDAAVNWTSGTRDIFCTQPAEKAVFLDADDNVNIISTDDGASDGPNLYLYRNSSSPADFDDLGRIYFQGNDDAGNRQDYAYIKGDQYDVSNGSEDAALLYYARVGGSDVVHMQHSFGQTYVYGRLYLQAGSIHSNPHIQFEGSTANAHETTFNATDPTADRTITLPDATGTVALLDGAQAFGENTELTSMRLSSFINVGGLSFILNQIQSTDTNAHIRLVPNGSGNVELFTDTVQVGEGANGTITTYGNNNLVLNTAGGANTGSIIIEDGANNDITITPNGTGSVVIDGLSYPQADGSNGQVLTTNGSGTLSFSTITSGVSNDDATALAIALG